MIGLLSNYGLMRNLLGVKVYIGLCVSYCVTLYHQG